jgi:hypothetical protein
MNWHARLGAHQQQNFHSGQITTTGGASRGAAGVCAKAGAEQSNNETDSMQTNLDTVSPILSNWTTMATSHSARFAPDQRSKQRKLGLIHCHCWSMWLLNATEVARVSSPPLPFADLVLSQRKEMLRDIQVNLTSFLVACRFRAGDTCSGVRAPTGGSCYGIGHQGIQKWARNWRPFFASAGTSNIDLHQ